MSKKFTEALELGDVVSIRGQVVGVGDNELTVEVSCNDRKHKHRVTLNGGQITDAVTFVEKADLPEADAPWEPFADAVVVEQVDAVAAADNGGAA